MRPVKFIHCADLHLGTPFKGISELNPHLSDLLRQSTYTSFDNIIALALKERVDCVLIAGDIYDSEDRSLRAQLHFRDGVSRLSDAGIRTLIAYGNHDPLNGWSAALNWPAGTFAFPANRVDCIPVEDQNEKIAMVYGISFGKREVTENLSLKFKPAQEHIPQIGLLHANVGGNTGHEPYAPCSVDDLCSNRLDYWALGHVHQGTIIRPANPAIAYPGCSQSRSPHEPGSKGCYVVTLASGVDPVIKFVATDVVRYASGSVDISSCSSLDEVADSIIKECEEMLDASDERNLLVRLSLNGKTPLQSQLQRTNSISDLLENVRDQLTDREPWIWLDQLNLNTAGTCDLELLRQGTDFTADIISVFDDIANPESPFRKELYERFQPLFSKWQGRDYLEQPALDELTALTIEAREQLLDLLVRET